MADAGERHIRADPNLTPSLTAALEAKRVLTDDALI
jgi:hypothetical protein